MIRKYSSWLFIIVTIVVPITVFAIVKWIETTYTKLPVFGQQGHKIAAFSLQDQSGNLASEAKWTNKIVVADFFFTHCPVVCPKMTRSLKEVQRLFINDPDLLITSFTVDPERDSSRRLEEYASKMDINGNWLLLTGDKKEIYKMARKSFLVTTTDGDGGPQDFIHSELLILIDKERRIRGYYNGTIKAEVEELVRDIGRLQKEYK